MTSYRCSGFIIVALRITEKWLGHLIPQNDVTHLLHLIRFGLAAAGTWLQIQDLDDPASGEDMMTANPCRSANPRRRSRMQRSSNRSA